MINICKKCSNQFEAKASWQKLCFNCYKQTPKAAKPAGDEVMDASRKIYGKLLDLENKLVFIQGRLERIEEKLQEIEIQELKLRLAHLGVNLEKLLAKNGKTTGITDENKGTV